MPAKIDDYTRLQGRQRIIEIMRKYNLKPREKAAELLNLPLYKIANWRNGATTFRKADELMMLLSIQRNLPKYKELATKELEAIEL
jgi:hypothetical protein